MAKMKSSLTDKAIMSRAIKDAFRKLAPRDQIKNPVMFLVYVSAMLTTVLFVLSLFGISDGIVSGGFILAITVILWLTSLFSNFAEAIAEVDKDIILMGLAGSKMLEAGKQLGLRVASEVFADRAYQADGSLVPRKLPGAVIHDKDEAIARTVRMVTEGKVTAITGEEVAIDAHSICVHGDNPSAVEFVKNIRATLESEGITIAPIAEIV